MPHDKTNQPITYIATHFPATSHTFIADEVEVLRQLGMSVVMVSINPVRDVDVATDVNGLANSTTYLKTTAKWRVVLAVALAIACHPSIGFLPLRAGTRSVSALTRRYFQLAEAILVYRIMRRAGSSHLHAHFGEAPATIAWYATEVARRHRAGRRHTWSVTIHGWHEFTRETDAMLQQKIAAAEFVVCVSDFTRAQLCRIADPRDHSKLHVVRCGIDLTRFTPRRNERASDPPRISIVSRVAPEKGHLVLVAAIAMLRQRGLELAVDAVGPEVDDYGQAVRQHALESGVSDAFMWHGSLPPDGVAGVLASATAFCLPTFAEGLPVVIMEAMAIGVPVVTTYIAGIPELAVDRATALVVPAGRADLLATALEEVVTNAALRQQLVVAAASAVREQHDIKQNVRVLAELFAHHGTGHQ
ncbi:glycosyltransferase [soil metagenome]